MEMRRALTKVLPQQCGEIPGVCFINAKRAVNEKIASCGGKRQWGGGGGGHGYK